MTDIPSTIARTIARPRRAIPGEDPEVARLSAMVIALLGEVAVLTERLDTVERLLDAQSLVTRDAIETFAPDTQAQGERDAKRRALVAGVLRPLRDAATQQAQQVQQ
ncbi:hypothetical protein [Sphingomonas faeni]|uniref:hypothetical protein n=1 Tax=Sphingomonas faeni TaxID=185950 RepID=UPI0020C83163|nr:hypothetical protein [Sphingomonas faeni]MCP8890736.1 hypothetical protein [Sphingomonas faeni]